MAGETGPNLGLHYKWDKGENDWDSLPLTEDEPDGGMQGNMLKLDAVVHCSVMGYQNAPPGAPDIGDRYLIAGSPSGAWTGHPGELAVCLDDSPVTWGFYHPKRGWLIDIQNPEVWRGLWVIGAGLIPYGRLRFHNAEYAIAVAVDPVDETKELRINLASIATGTARILTMPNKNITPMHVGGDSMSGNLNMQDNSIQRAKIIDQSAHCKVGTATNTPTPDFEVSNYKEVTLDDNWAPTFANPPASGAAGEMTIVIHQNASSAKTVTWPTGTHWPGGIAPTMSEGLNAVDIYRFITTDGGVTYWGQVIGQDIKAPL